MSRVTVRAVSRITSRAFRGSFGGLGTTWVRDPFHTFWLRVKVLGTQGLQTARIVVFSCLFFFQWLRAVRGHLFCVFFL